MRSGTFFCIITLFYVIGSFAVGKDNVEKSKIPHRYSIVLDRDFFPEWYITDSIIYHNGRVEFYEKYDSVGMVIYSWNIDRIIKE